MKNIQWLLLMLALFGFKQASADIFDDLAGALKTGNASEVARYFDNSVELKTGDKSAVYSKNQGELVLKQFFSTHPAKNFTVIHRGSSAKGARYAIGTYQTSNGENYRVYIYIKESSGKLFVQEITFEKE
jgi:hypothetical protein